MAFADLPVSRNSSFRAFASRPNRERRQISEGHCSGRVAGEDGRIAIDYSATLASGPAGGVGELAASIAHELNNPLGTVSLRLEGVLAKTPADDPRRRPLEVAEQEVERMARLVGNLLHFSRAGRDQISTVNVPDEVRKTIELTEPHVRRYGVTSDPGIRTGRSRYLCRSPATPPGAFESDHQCRGCDAQWRSTGSTRAAWPAARWDTRGRDRSERYGFRDPPTLSPSLRPFYHQGRGKGTGLGLAICRRIVQEHDGKLEIESECRPGDDRPRCSAHRANLIALGDRDTHA